MPTFVLVIRSNPRIIIASGHARGGPTIKKKIENTAFNISLVYSHSECQWVRLFHFRPLLQQTGIVEC